MQPTAPYRPLRTPITSNNDIDINVTTHVNTIPTLTQIVLIPQIPLGGRSVVCYIPTNNAALGLHSKVIVYRYYNMFWTEGIKGNNDCKHGVW